MVTNPVDALLKTLCIWKAGEGEILRRDDFCEVAVDLNRVRKWP